MSRKTKSHCLLCLYSGGEEILLELGGQDATEGYNEAGHTAKAHEILFELRVGKLKRVSGDPTPATLKVPSVSDNVANEGRDIAANGNRSRVSVLVAILLGGVLASAAYQYSRSKEVQP